jgi:hypothetical protein
MRHSLRIIKDVVREGRMFIDFGPELDKKGSNRAGQPFYEAERQAIQEAVVGNYAQDFVRAGKLKGGSASIGEVC